MPSQGRWTSSTALETRWADKAEAHPTVPPLSSPSRFPLAGSEAQEEEEEICGWGNKEAGLIHLGFDPMRVEGLCSQCFPELCQGVFGPRHKGHCRKGIFEDIPAAGINT